MKCTYSIEDLIGYTEGLMCDDDKEKLSKHLDSCEACRSRLGVLKLAEAHIKQDVRNDGTVHQKVMDTIDKDRYRSKKAKFRIGTFIYRTVPILKPLIAVILICSLTFAAVYNRQQVSSAISALGQILLLHFEKEDDKDKKNYIENSKLFSAEPVGELIKGKPPEGWVLSQNYNFSNLGDRDNVEIKLYVKPSSDPLSSKTETGEVLAYLNDGNEEYDLGLIGNYGTGDIEVKAQDLNNDGIDELSIRGGMGASSVQFKVIGCDFKKNKWMQWLNTDNTEVIDLDGDGNKELVTTSAGVMPPFVWIYRWNEDHFEKMDVAKVTGNEYATILDRNSFPVVLVSGNSNEKHIYYFREGNLEGWGTIKEALERDKAVNVYFNTFVTREIWGKQGPGENYDNVIQISYGCVIDVIGMYTADNGKDTWYLAKLTSSLTDDREKRQHTENQQEFWINSDSIGMKYNHTVTFEECSLDDATRFDGVITGRDKDDGIIHLKQYPDDLDSTLPVSIANQGNLISVIRKDAEWSLVRIIAGRAMEDYCDIGWIKNKDYTEYRTGVSVNQGFLVKPFRIYDKPDTNSTAYPIENIVKYDYAPVTVDDDKSNSDWLHIHTTFNGIAGWIKKEDIKYSLNSTGN